MVQFAARRKYAGAKVGSRSRARRKSVSGHPSPKRYFARLRLYAVSAPVFNAGASGKSVNAIGVMALLDEGAAVALRVGLAAFDSNRRETMLMTTSMTSTPTMAHGSVCFP